MTRHVKVLNARTFNNNVETEDGTLAKAIYDTVNAKTVVAMSCAKFGQNAICVVIYDDS